MRQHQQQQLRGACLALSVALCSAWGGPLTAQHTLALRPAPATLGAQFTISEPARHVRPRRGVSGLRASADTSNGSSVSRSSGGPPSKAEVKAAINAWAKATRPEGFKANRIMVSTGTTLPAVLSQFWTAVAECVEAKYEEERNGDSGFAAQLLFAAPYCELLGDARIMAQVDKTLDFCAGSCVAFGKIVLLQHYHPQLERADAATTALLRAPYPTFGLRIAPGPVEAEVVSTDTIAQARMHLELLLNSAVSSSSEDVVVPAGKRGYCGYPESVPTAESVLTKTKAWAAEVLENARRAGAGPQAPPTATGVPTRASQAPLDNWVAALEMVFQYSISGSRTTEEVLSDLWGTIEEVAAKAKDTQCRVYRPDGSADTYSPPVSALFVAPRFHSFNAEAFKRFGVALSIVLKQTPILDDFSIELYHPELILDDGEVDLRRRSPYPTIHLRHIGMKSELFPAPRRSRVSYPPADDNKDGPMPSDNGGTGGGGGAVQ